MTQNLLPLIISTLWAFPLLTYSPLLISKEKKVLKKVLLKKGAELHPILKDQKNLSQKDQKIETDTEKFSFERQDNRNSKGRESSHPVYILQKHTLIEGGYLDQGRTKFAILNRKGKGMYWVDSKWLEELNGVIELDDPPKAFFPEDRPERLTPHLKKKQEK